MSKPKTRILVTGGHVTPAVATIKQLQKQNTEILFLGRAYTDIAKSPSIEKKLAQELGVGFEYFESIKLDRHSPQNIIKSLIKLPKILYKASIVVREFKPDVILTFGGYLALPIALAGYLQDVPVVAHEQTSVVGLTNRLVEPFAKKLAVSWPSIRITKKRVLVGNPVRDEFQTSTQQPTWYKNTQKLPLIYITGGNQGSKAINYQVGSILDSLLKKYYLVIQTGSSRNKHDFNYLNRVVSNLPQTSRKNLYLSAWFDAQDVAWLIKHASLIVGRSGANTVTEIIVSRKKAVLIPLPVSAANEQHQNAKLLEKLKLAFVLDQKNINDLENIIDQEIKTSPSLHSLDLDRLVSIHTKAAAKLAELTIQCAEK